MNGFSFLENFVRDDGLMEHLFVMVVNVAIDNRVAGEFSAEENHLESNSTK